MYGAWAGEVKIAKEVATKSPNRAVSEAIPKYGAFVSVKVPYTVLALTRVSPCLPPLALTTPAVSSYV
jgi:hypothetical protein